MASTEATLLTLTEKAAERVRELMAEQPEGETLVLRVAVRGASCAGLDYALGFDGETLESDLVAIQHGVKVVVDPFSAGYLKGSTIDFVAAEGEEGFTIENPGAGFSCGCGSAYRAEQGEDLSGPACPGCGG